jgi:hypothetical protein
MVKIELHLEKNNNLWLQILFSKVAKRSLENDTSLSLKEALERGKNKS